MRNMILSLTTAAALALAPAAYAEQILLLEVDGVEGESTQPGYEGWIDIDAFGIQFSNPVQFGSGGGEGTGRAEPNPLQLQKKPDSSSPALLQSLFSGQHSSSASLHVLEQGPDGPLTLAEWNLELVFVTDFASDTSSHGTTEFIELSFPIVEYLYHQYDQAGELEGTFQAGWDFMSVSPTVSTSTTGTVDELQFITGTIPEPSSLMLLAGGAALGLTRRRRRA